jgi:hypothetical protein
MRASHPRMGTRGSGPSTGPPGERLPLLLFSRGVLYLAYTLLSPSHLHCSSCVPNGVALPPPRRISLCMTDDDYGNLITLNDATIPSPPPWCMRCPARILDQLRYPPPEPRATQGQALFHLSTIVHRFHWLRIGTFIAIRYRVIHISDLCTGGRRTLHRQRPMRPSQMSRSAGACASNGQSQHHHPPLHFQGLSGPV